MIELIHPIKIYKTKYTGDLELLKQTVIPKLTDVFEKTRLNNQDSMRNKGLCSYNAVRDLQSWSELTHYVSFLKEHLNIYWKELNYDPDRGPGIAEMWANCYEPGSFIDIHNHSPITITASFYLQKPTNSGNIVFEHPLETLLKHQPINHKDINAYGSWFQTEVAVEEGDLVLFPGYLKHKTTPNLDLSNRIIIGANVLPVINTVQN